jgi:hypothetical protein
MGPAEANGSSASKPPVASANALRHTLRNTRHHLASPTFAVTEEWYARRAGSVEKLTLEKN